MTIVKDEAEAIRLANDSRYGLAGSVWTRDIEKGIAIAKKMETGAVFINTLVKSDPRLPFGGIKKSGYGRELGRHGILEFVNAKSIVAEASKYSMSKTISRSQELLDKRKQFVPNAIGIFNPSTAVSARGSIITDADGKEMIDFAGGIGGGGTQVIVRLLL